MTSGGKMAGCSDDGDRFDIFFLYRVLTINPGLPF